MTMTAPIIRFPDPDDLIFEEGEENEPEFLSEESMEAIAEDALSYDEDDLFEVEELDTEKPFGWDIGELIDWDAFDGECAYDN